MSEQNTNNKTSATPSRPITPRTGVKRPFVRPGQKSGTGSKFGGKDGKGGPRGDRGPRTFAERAKPEFEQRVLDIRRVTRVVSGGRRMSFAVALVIGDGKGSVGLGTGKGADTAIAINKALKAAKKSMIKIKLTKDASLPHEVYAKYTTSKVMIMPNRGKGLVAGSAVRDVLSMAGVKNVTSKIYSGSKNRLNNGRATIMALSQVAEKRIVREVEKESPEAKKEA
jgi:small subunit ribosomal protein S5